MNTPADEYALVYKSEVVNSFHHQDEEPMPLKVFNKSEWWSDLRHGYDWNGCKVVAGASVQNQFACKTKIHNVEEIGHTVMEFHVKKVSEP